MQIRGFRFKICSTSRSRPRFRTTQDYVIFDCGILWLSKLVHFKVRHRSLARLPAFFDVDAYRTWLARYTLRRTERVQNHVTSASYSRDPIRVILFACIYQLATTRVGCAKRGSRPRCRACLQLPANSTPAISLPVSTERTHLSSP